MISVNSMHHGQQVTGYKSEDISITEIKKLDLHDLKVELYERQVRDVYALCRRCC